MKVAIITIFDLMNYGNRLQNYATNHYLQKNNIQVETIVLDYSTVYEKCKNSIKKMLHRPTYMDWNLKQESAEYIEKLNEHEKKKYDKFRLFSYKYINIQHKKYIKGWKCKWLEDYDFFIVGSDQVWNPYIAQAKEWEFLCFAPPGKRISWSASFGVKKISDSKKIIANGLSGMDYISVREESGKEIVSELSNKKAVTLVDPTLMLDASEWNEISNKPDNMCIKKYILLFFLGEISDSVKEKAKNISDKYGYEIVNLLDESCVVYESGPSEFIYLISHAQLVLTDSFHACVFSFLFNRPFYVYNRNWKQGNMNSRLETFLKKFHLERKYANSRLENDLWEHNYDSGYQQLELERQRTTEFLKKILRK